MTNKELLIKRFEANKMANYADSLRLEGLQSKPETSKLSPKVIEKIKQISSSRWLISMESAKTHIVIPVAQF